MQQVHEAAADGLHLLHQPRRRARLRLQRLYRRLPACSASKPALDRSTECSGNPLLWLGSEGLQARKQAR